MSEVRKVKVFIGFQIDSTYHDAKDLKDAFHNAKIVAAKLFGIEMECVFGEFPVGGIIHNEVKKAISDSTIAFFDVSENNPNVWFEAGLAYGNDKGVVLLKNIVSKKNYSIPSDLAGVIYLQYPNKNSLRDSNISEKIAQTVNSTLMKYPTRDYYFKSLMGLEDDCEVAIICSELESAESRQNPEPDEFLYVYKYGDLDSLICTLISLNSIYHNAKIRFLTSDELQHDNSSMLAKNLIIIGGPDYNETARMFGEHIPISYCSTENGETLLRTEDGREFHSKSEKIGNGVKVTDYGFFSRVINPHNPKSRLIIIGGIHTHGVLGASKCFSMTEESEMSIAESNCRKVIDKKGSDPIFTAIIKTTSINNKLVTPTLEDEFIL